MLTQTYMAHLAFLRLASLTTARYVPSGLVSLHTAAQDLMADYSVSNVPRTWTMKKEAPGRSGKLALVTIVAKSRANVWKAHLLVAQETWCHNV